MHDFLDQELKEIDILDERLTLNSALNEDKLPELETLADAIIASIK
jgi:hypothetical protein